MSASLIEFVQEGGSVGIDVDFYNVDLDTNNLFEIGNHVTLTNCRLLCHDACLVKTTECVRVSPIRIGDNVFVGAGSIILPNTTIGNNVIIGAGTVVTHDIPDNSIVVGNPARIICSFEEFVSREYERIREEGLVEGDWKKIEYFQGKQTYRYAAVRPNTLADFMKK